MVLKLGKTLREKLVSQSVETVKKSFKSNLHSLYSLNTLRVPRVSGAHLRGFARGFTLQGCNGGESWQRVGDLIDSGSEPHTSRTRGRRLTSYHLRHLAG